MKLQTTAFLLLFLAGCKTFTMDTSMSAAQAGDATIVHSAGSGIPSQGFDILRVIDGDPITQVWSIVLPVAKNLVQGTLRIKYKDKVITKNIDSSVIKVKWSEIVGEDHWVADMSGVAAVDGRFQFKTSSNGANFTDVYGYAFVRVLPQGYDPLPIGSPLGVWNSTCKVAYSTAGRSSLTCQP